MFMGKNQMAGEDCLTSFLKCNKTLSIHRPQATSMSRSTSFNKTNVTKTVLTRYNFEAKDIWNMDETGTTMVQVPDKIIATKGQRKVGAVTSGERGTLVTVAFAANAQDNFVPPYFIFPRKKFQHHFIRDGPLDCIGSANGSGWMQEIDFLAFLQHFARHTRMTPESKLLLLLDNHPSHLFGTSSGTPIQRFSPEKVRPYPKAGSRRENKRGRKRSTAILTNTPVKAALEEETRQRGQKKQSSSKRPKKTLSGYISTTVSWGYEEECLVSGEAFASSLPGEGWVQCIFCLLWSHEACAEDEAHICHNCENV